MYPVPTRGLARDTCRPNGSYPPPAGSGCFENSAGVPASDVGLWNNKRRAVDAAGGPDTQTFAPAPGRSKLDDMDRSATLNGLWAFLGLLIRERSGGSTRN